MHAFSGYDSRSPVCSHYKFFFRHLFFSPHSSHITFLNTSINAFRQSTLHPAHNLFSSIRVSHVLLYSSSVSLCTFFQNFTDFHLYYKNESVCVNIQVAKSLISSFQFNTRFIQKPSLWDSIYLCGEGIILSTSFDLNSLTDRVQQYKCSPFFLFSLIFFINIGIQGIFPGLWISQCISLFCAPSWTNLQVFVAFSALRMSTTSRTQNWKMFQTLIQIERLC